MLSFPRIFRAIALAALVFPAGAAIAVHASGNPDQVAELKQTGSCAGCDLSNADLQGVSALGGDLTGANLGGANLYRAVLRAADLTGANLDGANLSGANLEGSVGAVLNRATTDERTICPSGLTGPCAN